MSHSRLSVRLSRLRTPTTPLRRGAWTLPYHTVETGDGIERYANPDYRFPGNATSDAITEISQRFSSSLPSFASSMPSHPGICPSSLRASVRQHLEPPVGYAELAGQEIYEMPDFEQTCTLHVPLTSLQSPAFEQEPELQERPAWKEQPIAIQELSVTQFLDSSPNLDSEMLATQYLDSGVSATQYLDSGDVASSWEVSPLTAD